MNIGDFKDGFFLGGLISFGATGIAGLLLFHYEVDLLNALSDAASLITALGFLLAVFVYRRNSEWRKLDESEKKSKAYLGII